MAENLNLKTVETVDTRPFRKLVMTIGELPTSFIESMTYYELLAWFTNYLETVIIPTVNNNGEAVEELQQKYIELKANTEQEIDDFENKMTTAFNTLKDFVDNYFDNLDVQEEINNKLDQMAEDGILQEIITTYIQSNVAWAFDTVADMKLATNLVNGSFAQTLGFNSKDDLGGAIYKIRTKAEGESANEIDKIALYDTTLIAEIVPISTINVKQLGAKGDGVTDETSLLNAIFSYCNTNDIHTIIFPYGTYNVSDTVTIYSNSIIQGAGKNATIINNTATDDTESNHFIFAFESKTNLKLSGITFKGSKGASDYSVTSTKLYFGLRLNNATNVVIDNCEFKQIYTTALSIRNSSDITITNNTFTSNGWNDIGMTHTISRINILDNNFSDIGYHAINAEDGEMNEPVSDILISGNKMNTNNSTTQPVAIQFSYSQLSGSGHRYINIIITNNDIHNTWVGCIVKFVENLVISNNIFEGVGRCINNTTTNMTDPNANFIIDSNFMNANHTLSLTNETYCLELGKITNSRISNNTMINGSANNATLSNATYCEFKNNQIISSGQNGLVTSGNNLHIEGNIIKDTNTNAIYLTGCSKTFVNHNQIENAGDHGIIIHSSGSYYQINDNYIIGCTGSGIRFTTGANGNKFAQICNNMFGDYAVTPTMNYGVTASVDVDYVVIENTYLLTTGTSLRGSQHWGTNCVFRNNEGFGTLPA